MRRPSKAWPDVPGMIRTTVPLERCSMCPPAAPLVRAGTWTAYNGEPTCLDHALMLDRVQKLQAEAAAALADLKEARERKKR